jgi:hypothetical protein
VAVINDYVWFLSIIASNPNAADSILLGGSGGFRERGFWGRMPYLLYFLPLVWGQPIPMTK